MIKINANLINKNLLNRLVNRSNLRCCSNGDKQVKNESEVKVSKSATKIDGNTIEDDLKKLKQLREELSNNDSHIYNEYKQQEKGFIYDKRPIKVKCKKGKIYMWCACGHSKHQPFCDGTHRIRHYQISLKPFPFTAKEDKEYWFCNCKQSQNRPLCDGTHKEDFVQNAKSTLKS